jgi:hypothetical protein
MNNEETITIGWCDNGVTEGAFTEGLLKIALHGYSVGFPINSCLRTQGNQIARQRQTLLDFWYYNLNTEWLFCIDSDIAINLDIWQKICTTADKEKYPIVSGVYFISKELEGSLPIVLPCIFNDLDDNSVEYIHPLPENQIIKIDCAGMGLVIIHRDVVTKLKEEYGQEAFLFAEDNAVGDKFVGEDIAFFRKCKKADIPIYADTGAIAKHLKRVIWDTDYYKLYWNSK